jgi:hypothetical protein
MAPGAEEEVTGIATSAVQPLRLRETLPIVIGREDAKDDLISFADTYATKVDVFDRGP